jgi:predicted membrane channel-forming protein YqfA (hemolysin III family)
MLVVGSLVSKFLYMLMTCLGSFIMLISWLDSIFCSFGVKDLFTIMNVLPPSLSCGGA